MTEGSGGMVVAVVVVMMLCGRTGNEVEGHDEIGWTRLPRDQ